MRLLCSVEDVPDGTMKSFSVGRTRVVVIHSRGIFCVLRDSCPHQGAPLSGGRLTGTMLPGPYGEYRLAKLGEVVRCPWHAWEFDVHTGCSLHDPEHDRVKAYPVSVIGGDILVDGLGEGAVEAMGAPA
jgi:3-phenylpropionate/trans-cinnamate dioxygenase ferredoxin subunit